MKKVIERKIRIILHKSSVRDAYILGLEKLPYMPRESVVASAIALNFKGAT